MIYDNIFDYLRPELRLYPCKDMREAALDALVGLALDQTAFVWAITKQLAENGEGWLPSMAQAKFLLGSLIKVPSSDEYVHWIEDRAA